MFLGKKKIRIPEPYVREVPRTRGDANYFMIPQHAKKTGPRPDSGLQMPRASEDVADISNGANDLVVVYELTGKLVDPEHKSPETSKQIIYYTLSVGHNTGTFDCFAEKLICSRKDYLLTLDLFEEGPALNKFMGVEAFGEIEINAESAPMLSRAVAQAYKKLEAELAEKHKHDLPPLPLSGPVEEPDDPREVILKTISLLLEHIANEAAVHITLRALTRQVREHVAS